jgi:hypothetical protein
LPCNWGHSSFWILFWEFRLFCLVSCAFVVIMMLLHSNSLLKNNNPGFVVFEILSLIWTNLLNWIISFHLLTHA